MARCKESLLRWVDRQGHLQSEWILPKQCLCEACVQTGLSPAKCSSISMVTQDVLCTQYIETLTQPRRQGNPL